MDPNLLCSLACMLIAVRGLYGLSKKAAFDALPSFGRVITCHAVFPEGFVVYLLCPPIQVLSLNSGKVERIR